MATSGIWRDDESSSVMKILCNRSRSFVYAMLGHPQCPRFRRPRVPCTLQEQGMDSVDMVKPKSGCFLFLHFLELSFFFFLLVFFFFLTPVPLTPFCC